jgi:hypothetical protein
MLYLFDAATLKNAKIRKMILSKNTQLKLIYYMPKHRAPDPLI